MKVLIIDDEPLEIEQIQFLIKKRFPDWEIFAAEDVSQAKRILEKVQIPLALVDIQLPGASGLDFSEYVKNHNRKMEIILITAYQTFEYAKRALRLKVLDYLVKPVIEQELYDAIDKFFAIHHYAETNSDMINQVLQIIRENYAKKISLQWIADQVHVNPAYLSRKFTEEVGMHFKDYLVKYRIEQAKNLMRQHPTWPIARVSDEVGFATQHHFSNSFKKVVGVSPTQYKESVTHD